MGKDAYYFTSRAMPKFGRLYFLKALQEASSDGGGESLLGSVAQSVCDSRFIGLWCMEHFPVPAHMSRPKIVREFIERRKSRFNLRPEDTVVLTQNLLPAQSSIEVGRKYVFGAEAGPFPAVPVTLGIDVDYSLADSVSMQFGPDARLQYIPLGYLGQAYSVVSGDSKQIDPSGVLEDNYVVDSILMAKEFEVRFTSTKTFTASFQAKLEAFKKIPAVSAKVKYELVDKHTLVARVQGSDYYLVALGASEWDHLDLT